jgi:hypothetical protein
MAQKLTKAQMNAKAMAAAFAKMGAVARATNVEIRQAIYALSDMGDHDGVNLLISEEGRRAAALSRLKAEVPTIFV